MITVTALSAGDRHAISVVGHASYDGHNDIVCAACSAITFAFISWIINAAQHMYDIDKLYTADHGEAHIDATGDTCYSAAFDMTVIGLAQIAHKYPDKIQITLT